MKNIILFFIAFWVCINLYSQNNYPKEKVRLENDTWFGLNAQISLKSKNDKSMSLDSALFYPTFGIKNTFFVQVLAKHTALKPANKAYFYQQNIYLTYERWLSQKWVGGISFRYSELHINTTTLRTHIRHYSPIPKIEVAFWQQLAIEKIISDNSFYKPVSRLRFQFGINKYIPISAQKKLIGTISFELFKEIQKISTNSERRFFQEQRIQTEWLFPIHKNIYLGAFAGLHTKQFIALAQYNMNGQELKPTRRLNQQLPVLGANIVLTLGKNTIPNKRIWIE